MGEIRPLEILLSEIRTLEPYGTEFLTPKSGNKLYVTSPFGIRYITVDPHF